MVAYFFFFFQKYEIIFLGKGATFGTQKMFLQFNKGQCPNFGALFFYAKNRMPKNWTST
jgi:hypothetical protein